MFHVVTTSSKDSLCHIVELDDEEALRSYIVQMYKVTLNIPDNVRFYKVEPITPKIELNIKF